MIHLFNSKKRILFFPVGFANSVARWILGVHSPSGTISIKNTATPGDNGSLALDVNVDALRRIMAGVIDDHDLTEREIKRTKDIVHGAIDGTSLIMGGEHISVSMDWLQQNIQKFLGDETEITHDKITDWDAATAWFLTDDDYDTLSGAITDLSDIVDEILTELDGYLTVDDIGVTVAEEDHTHTTANITDWDTATADFLTDADMSNYALEADLLTLAEEVTGIEGDILDLADAVEAIDTDLAALEDDFDDLYAALYPSGTKGWVDLTTAQTVGGVKTFSEITKHNSHIDISGSHSLRMFLKRNNGVQGWESIAFFTLDGINIGQVICGNDSSSAHGTYFRAYNGGSIYSGIGVHLDVDNKGSQTLERPPTEDTSSTSDMQIAWRGWVNNYFSRKTHHHDDVYANISHTHSGYATTNHTHSGYASSNHNHAGVYANETHQHVADDITDLGTTIDEKITTFSNTVSTTYATEEALEGLTNTVNEIDDDILEIADYVDSMDEDIAALAEWYATGREGTFNVVTNVEWTGTVLRMSQKSVTFTNGLITAIGNDSTVTIDTPVLFEQS